MEKLDWNYVIKLFISSGVGLVLLKWAVPVLFKQAIRDIIKDIVDSVDDHEGRLSANELGVVTHSSQLTTMKSSLDKLQQDIAIIERIDRNMENFTKQMSDVSKALYILQGRWDGSERRDLLNG